MGYVLEGPDGAGKTTLARELAQKYQMRWNHFGPPTRPPLEEYLHWLVDLDPDHHRVIDRFHLGESVYGPIFRGTLPLSVPTLCTIEWALMVRGYTLVHVTKPLKTLVDALEERGDDMVQIHQLAQIVEAYWSIMRMSFMPRIDYDWTFPPTNDIMIDLPTARYQRSQQYSFHCNFYGSLFPGTGSLTPEYILVGERTNPNLKKESRAVPFAVGTSATWLLQAIWRNNWQDRVYLTNAKKVNGDEDTCSAEIRWLQREAHRDGRPQPRVLALGRSATRILKKHKIKSTEIVHPSYHRRFHHGDGPDTYAALLAAS